MSAPSFTSNRMGRAVHCVPIESPEGELGLGIGIQCSPGPAGPSGPAPRHPGPAARRKLTREPPGPSSDARCHRDWPGPSCGHDARMIRLGDDHPAARTRWWIGSLPVSDRPHPAGPHCQAGPRPGAGSRSDAGHCHRLACH
jgi:hypothetical protein